MKPRARGAVMLVFAALWLPNRGAAPAAGQQEVAFTRTPTSFGTFDGPGAIGEVTDVAVFADGRLAVLDRQAGDIKVFAGDGSMLGVVGREGGGPGEFNWPTAIVVTAEGYLLVLDPGNRRSSRFSVQGAEASLLDELTLDFVAHDSCTIGTRVYVLGLVGGAAIHELGSEGLASGFDRFPRVAGGIEGMEQRHQATGYLVCDESRGRLAVLPLIRRDVRIYDAEGLRLGTLALPGYRQTTLNVLGRGSIQLGMDPESGTVHEALGAASLPEGILLQAVEKDLNGAVRAPQTWLIDGTNTLRELRGVPSAVRLVAGADAYIVADEPFPHVQLWRIHPDGRRE
jgi:hypothetical protein